MLVDIHQFLGMIADNRSRNIRKKALCNRGLYRRYNRQSNIHSWTHRHYSLLHYVYRNKVVVQVAQVAVAVAVEVLEPRVKQHLNYQNPYSLHIQ